MKPGIGCRQLSSSGPRPSEVRKRVGSQGVACVPRKDAWETQHGSHTDPEVVLSAKGGYNDVPETELECRVGNREIGDADVDVRGSGIT